MKRKKVNRLIGIFLLAAMVIGGCASDNIGQADTQQTVDVQDTEASGNTETTEATETSDERGYLPEGISPVNWDAGENPTGDQLYYASRRLSYFSEYYGNDVALNGFGQMITENSISVGRIRDVITGEIRYYSAYYKTFKKIPKEYYDDYEVKMYSRLYELDGTLISDWENVSYSGAIGDWALKTPYQDFNYASENAIETGVLVNTKTGETISDIENLEEIGDENAFAKRTDASFAILSKDGSVVADSNSLQVDIPAFSFISSCDDIIIGTIESYPTNDIYFFKSDGSLIGHIDNVGDSYIYSENVMYPFVICDYKIYDLSKGDGGILPTVLEYSDQMGVCYYDGQIMVCEETDDYGKYTAYIKDVAAGAKLSSDYDRIELMDVYYLPKEEKSIRGEYFYGMTGDRVEKIDRTGKVISSFTCTNMNQMYVDSYGITCYADDFNTAYHLDLDLKEIDLGKYRNVYPVYEYNGVRTTMSDLMVGSYELKAGSSTYQRYDILNANLEPIATDFSLIGNIVDGAVTVSKGQTIGTVDYNGNWLVKYNKYEYTNAD